MNNLEPRIYRQRLILEGHYSIDPVDGETIRDYLQRLSDVAQMTIFAGPYSWPPDPWDNRDVKLSELNGFTAWTESGVHIYAWRSVKFVTVDIYTCKVMDVDAVVRFTTDYFRLTDREVVSL